MKKLIALVVIMATVFACSVSAAAAEKDDGEYSYVKKGNEDYFVDGNYNDVVDKYISATKEFDNYFRTKVEVTSLSAEEDHFIPYGFVKKDGSFIKKNSDGSFSNVPENEFYKQYKRPDGITTFAVSHDITSKQPVFGSYAVNLKTEGINYGTMLMVGEWDAFYAKFIETYKTDAALMAKISEFYDEHKGEHNYVGLKWDDKVIKVYKTPQNNYMWKNDTDIQYAVKISGLKSDEQCVAIGYYKAGSDVIFSSEFKCGTLN